MENSVSSYVVTWVSLQNFDTISAQIGHTANENLNQTILRLGAYLFQINLLSSKNCVVRFITRNTQELKVKICAARIIEMNEYLDIFPG